MKILSLVLSLSFGFRLCGHHFVCFTNSADKTSAQDMLIGHHQIFFLIKLFLDFDVINVCSTFVCNSVASQPISASFCGFEKLHKYTYTSLFDSCFDKNFCKDFSLVLSGKAVHVEFSRRNLNW